MASAIDSPLPGPNVETRIVRDYEAFRATKDDWNDLLDRSTTAYAWLTHQWLDCWWRSFGTEARMFIPTVWSDGRLVAAAPMMIVDEIVKRLNCRVLRFMANSLTPRSQFLLAADDGGEANVLWKLIRTSSRDWDLAMLANVPHDSSFSGTWRDARKDTGMRFVEAPDRQSPFIDLSDGFDAFHAGLGRNLRDNIGDSRKRLSKLGTVDVQSVLGAGDLADALQTCYAISAHSWKAAISSDLGSKLEYRSFYHALTQDDLLRARLYIWILRLEGEPIAFRLVIRSGSSVTGLATDYDLDFKRCSPGVFLFSRLLEELPGLGVDQYDMDGELHDFKLFWTKQYLSHSRFWVYHSGPKSRLLHFTKDKALPTFRRPKAPTAVS
jgi:CelD/BcsL family acetyltransferase involved in cellulose biosynthesis